MYEGLRKDGRYYLRPIAPDYMHEISEITEEQFYDRWRAWGGKESDIQQTKSHNRDFSVL